MLFPLCSDARLESSQRTTQRINSKYLSTPLNLLETDRNPLITRYLPGGTDRQAESQTSSRTGSEWNQQERLGVKTTSLVYEEGVPAWEQDLENTEERGKRRQDKEKAMERMRQLGYM